MSNEQLLVAMVDDSAMGCRLAEELLQQVTAKGCVLKPEAVPWLEKTAQKLNTASQAAQVLLRRARGEEPPKCD
jgi:hypothetical protein